MSKLEIKYRFENEDDFISLFSDFLVDEYGNTLQAIPFQTIDYNNMTLVPLGALEVKTGEIGLDGLPVTQLVSGYHADLCIPESAINDESSKYINAAQRIDVSENNEVHTFKRRVKV